MLRERVSGLLDFRAGDVLLGVLVGAMIGREVS